jgi:ATP-binding cassette subfamily B protein
LLGLWRLLRGFRLTYSAATASLAVAAATKTLTYLLLAYFVDQVIGAPNAATRLPWVALGFVALAAIEGFFTFLSGKLAAAAAEGITLRLRSTLFDHIQRLSFAYHAQTPTGELISRATSDVDAVRRFYAEQAIGMGRIVLLFGINFGMIYRINARLAWVSVITIPLIVAVSIYFFRRISQVYETYQEQEAVVSTTLQENLSGVRVVKAFARQPFEIAKFEKENWEKYRQGVRLGRLHASFWPTSDVICGFQLLAAYLYGAALVINGVLTLGDYLAFSGMVIWINFPIRNLGRLIVQTSTGMVSFGRVMEVIDQEQEDLSSGAQTPSDCLRGEISFEGVGFAYDPQTPILHDVSFDVAPGQVIALLGPTGSGKTSLVNLLPRFYDYTAGRILLDGRELTSYARQTLRQAIGIVEQEPFLFSRSLRENIAYGVARVVTDAEIEAAARAAAIHDVILALPEGYATLVGEKGVTLSGGQKQRIAIARTLLKDPCILILDDSTSAVDTETEADIRQALQNLMRGRTTFIIAHRIQSVQHADLILVLEGGQVVARGTHAELLAGPPDSRYRQIYQIQTRIEDELATEIAAVAGAAEGSASHD